MGFGGSNHLVLKVAKYKDPGSNIFVFSRNANEREFALSLGAAWAGAIDEVPPERLHAVIDTTPVWSPIAEALKHLEPGGRLVINAIRKEAGDLAALGALNYERHLWLEKEIKSVANVTRRDVGEFLEVAAAIGLKPRTEVYPLGDANRALMELKTRPVTAAKVLHVSD